jgi:hypothetical protein
VPKYICDRQWFITGKGKLKALVPLSLLGGIFAIRAGTDNA